jgi:hypothetical protein
MSAIVEYKRIKVRLSGFTSVKSIDIDWEGRLEHLDERMQEIARTYHPLYWRADVFVEDLSTNIADPYKYFTTYQFKVTAVNIPAKL